MARSRPPFQLRRARTTDVPALVTIERSVFDLEQLTARAFRRYATRPSADVIVATQDDQAVGYAIASFRSGGSIGRLISIAVVTDAVGRGIGTALIGEVHSLSILRGALAMMLEVRRDNLAALNLYKRLGYLPIGEKPSYYADFCDAIVFKCQLIQP